MFYLKALFFPNGYCVSTGNCQFCEASSSGAYIFLFVIPPEGMCDFFAAGPPTSFSHTYLSLSVASCSRILRQNFLCCLSAAFFTFLSGLVAVLGVKNQTNLQELL
ncbi:hypothetical protein TWF225_009872 [Orbilia oligospora]|uniref:Uncharacterized protein n=1 Tax=Orbilia oligospora TaxID=2813651 RepID=A0A7C8P4T6_ORBOL|nr:hypothetical protein TWF751_008771 [Orbilia oligospora]KAF3173092.1 hypothetical protein TWF225_009872 [Orbilia oligospora]KAF3266352.1 hypothetical protein TWF128_010767 [Orbilia oligospora]KAF3269281.1 hypothetical protein TWF217_009371 [Orbilia oligospora]KAF3291649.1 hypothetical protein TWF132_006637 [Orbilia oligospora]